MILYNNNIISFLFLNISVFWIYGFLDVGLFLGTVIYFGSYNIFRVVGNFFFLNGIISDFLGGYIIW